MVLFKRKPVSYPPTPPLPENTNVRCWYIPVTKEWFTDYNEYLKRMDYYKTKKFVCEITGNSCLTFFEAYQSEVKEMKLVERYFPEHLKEPILRHIQFSVVPRIDQLVDEVYTAFKNDYYPGENVVVRLNDFRNDFKTRCVIREKAKFNAIYDAEGNIFRPAYAQYRVARTDDNTEIVVDESQITRDRNNFTKWFVKAFIKLCVTRSSKIGAPWIVKKKYADRYRIPTELPADLAHFKEDTSTTKKRKLAPILSKDDLKSGARKGTPDSKGRGTPGTGGWKKNGQILPKTMSTPPPPQPKKIVQEDLLNDFELTIQKPMPHALDELGEFVSDALESWSFLNVYREPLVLDTFTFDDFLTAMKWNSHQRCPLQDEIFCAVLSGFCKVGGTELEFAFPEDFDSDMEIDEPLTDEEDEVKDEEPNGKATEKSLEADDKKDDEASGEKTNDESNPENVKDEDTEESNVSKTNDSYYDEDTNKAELYLNYRNMSFIERLSKRNFKDGGWQIILIGVLDEVSHLKSWKPVIKEIFDRLAPLETTVSNNSLLTYFQALDAGLKIKALNILCKLLVNSPLIRQHLEKCMEESTALRRERLEKLRDYKIAYENAQNADREIREKMDQNNDKATNNSSEEPEAKKRKRRGNLNVEPTEEEMLLASTNTKVAELLATRTAQLKIAEDLRVQRRALEKQIVELDVQRIRFLGKDRLYNRYWWFENNGLPNLGGGKGSHDDDEDGEGEGGADDDDDDEEDLQDETYLMGRLWVQGPSEEDFTHGLKIKDELLKKWRELSFDTVEEEKESAKQESEEVKKEDPERTADAVDSADKTQDENATQEEIKPIMSTKLPPRFIKAAEVVFGIKFDESERRIKSVADGRALVDEYGATVAGLTPEQRKIIEEYPDPLFTAVDWRYYDKVDEIEKLMKWLNPWGKREQKLIKELTAVKDKITSSIEARRKALKLDTKTSEELHFMDILEDTVISETEFEEDSEGGEDDDDDEFADEDDETSSGTELDTPETPRTRQSKAQADKAAEEKRKREEQLREKLAEKEARRLKSRPAARIARRQERRRKAREHKQKRALLADTQKKLEKIRQDMSEDHCLEWVNSSALEKLGYMHYEGPKKARGRPQRGK